jgi:predicted nucleic acid-binding protein
MTSIIVDASVAAKWFLRDSQEPLLEQAAGLLEDYVTGRVHFLVPDLFWAEIGNILWKSVRLGRQAKSTAEAALKSLQEHPFTTISSRHLLHTAFEISTGFDRSFYDSLYIAAAVESRCTMITADQRLATAVSAALPVKWLGASY